MFSSFYHRQDFYQTLLYVEHSGCLIRSMHCLPFARTWGYSQFLEGSVMLIFLVFYVVLYLLFYLSSFYVMCGQCCLYIWTSVVSNVYLLKCTLPVVVLLSPGISPFHKTKAICVYANPINIIGKKYSNTIKAIWYIVCLSSSQRGLQAINRLETYSGTNLCVSIYSISGSATQADTSHITIIITLARFLVLLKASGRQMAYQRSTEMAARVNTETEIETAYKIIKVLRVKFWNTMSIYSWVMNEWCLTPTQQFFNYTMARTS